MDQQAETELERAAKLISAGISAAELAGIIAGVAAGPGDDGRIGGAGDWTRLISETLGGEEKSALAALLGNAVGNAETDDRDGAERLSALRHEMAARKLDGFLVPLADEHQGEYVPKRARRLRWLTGFTGSAGLALVMKDRAVLFVDGRYILQAAEQVDTGLFDILHLIEQPPAKWIAGNLARDARLGFDPWLHTADAAKRYRRAAEKGDAALIAVKTNPIDAVWRHQPPPPLWPIEIQDIADAGKSSAQKREQISTVLAEADEDAVVFTQPDGIAWLANIRGGDVPYTPFVLAFAILHRDGNLKIFTDRRKLTPAVEDRLEPGIEVIAGDEFAAALKALGDDGASVRVDPASTSEAVFTHLKDAGAKISRAEDPCALPKACKNETELAGMREAHRTDGAALARFLAWLDANAASGGVTEPGVTEIGAAERLEALRREDDAIRGLSFPTISATGSNGAIVHYHVTSATNKTLKPGFLYLVDSGAQYRGGTTDVTRTVAIGTPAPEMIENFTRVLKGHIALASVVFPDGTTGAQLDVLARTELWRAGLDYDHGTGHGVGSFLSVHEGPQRVSKIPNRIALKPGMVLSNEPGYYKEGAYGIRIENLITVRESAPLSGGKKPFLEFEALTLAPIDLGLVDAKMLSGPERPDRRCQ